MYLLYVYAWMPFPRRVILYLRQRNIPSDLVRIVDCKGPYPDCTPKENFPPPPSPTLPLLAIPPSAYKTDALPKDLEGWRFLRQSPSILHYLECQYQSVWKASPHTSSASYSMIAEHPDDALNMAHVLGYSSSAEGAICTWNAVRNFGSGVGPEIIPNAAIESLKWVHRELACTEQYLNPDSSIDLDYGGYEKRLTAKEGSNTGPIFSDINLLSFLELVDDLYGCFDQLTLGNQRGVGNDAYNRSVKGYGFYPNIRRFYALYRTRESASRDESNGEGVPTQFVSKASSWADGVFPQ